jgi:hypothetical protein
MANPSRRRFLAGAAALAAGLVAGSRAIAQDRPSRKITVYKNPT